MCVCLSNLKLSIGPGCPCHSICWLHTEAVSLMRIDITLYRFSTSVFQPIGYCFLKSVYFSQWSV